MKQKIQSKKGFTLSEVLMTVIILTLVTSVIAGGVGVARNAYMKVTLKAEALTLRSTALSAAMSELRYAQNVEQDDSGNYSFDSPSKGYRIYFYNGNNEILVGDAYNTAIPLLTEQTKTNNLVPSIEYFFDKTKGTFSLNVTVKQMSGSDEKTIATGDPLTVRPVNIQYDTYEN